MLFAPGGMNGILVWFVAPHCIGDGLADGLGVAVPLEWLCGLEGSFGKPALQFCHCPGCNGLGVGVPTLLDRLWDRLLNGDT